MGAPSVTHLAGGARILYGEAFACHLPKEKEREKEIVYNDYDEKDKKEEDDKVY